MLKALADTLVKDIDQRLPVIAATDDTLFAVVGRMRELKRGGCVVRDENGELVGVLTQHDLATRVNLDHEGWGDTVLGVVMTQNPASVNQEASLAVALHRMNEIGCRSLPVVNDGKEPIGVISIRDILCHVADYFPQELLNLPPDPTLEARRPWGG